MLTARLPSDDATAPPDGPTVFIVGIPPGGCCLPGPPPPPQPTAASVNEQRIDVWNRRTRMTSTNRFLRRRIEPSRANERASDRWRARDRSSIRLAPSTAHQDAAAGGVALTLRLIRAERRRRSGSSSSH